MSKKGVAKCFEDTKVRMRSRSPKRLAQSTLLSKLGFDDSAPYSDHGRVGAVVGS